MDKAGAGGLKRLGRKGARLPVEAGLLTWPVTRLLTFPPHLPAALCTVASWLLSLVPRDWAWMGFFSLGSWQMLKPQLSGAPRLFQALMLCDPPG